MEWYEFEMIWYVWWFYVVQCDLIWFDMIWYDMIWYDLIWFDMIWYDMMWCDMIWYDLIWVCVKNIEESIVPACVRQFETNCLRQTGTLKFQPVWDNSKNIISDRWELYSSYLCETI